MYQNKPVTLAITLAALVAVVGLLGWGYYFISRSSTPQYSNERSVFSVLTADNAAFNEANQLIRAGNFQAGRAKYVEALSFARDSFQNIYIKYRIAGADEALGDYTLAIQEFKEIADTPISYNLLRAYAVMRVGLIYELRRDSQNQASIVAETFKGEPYDSFLTGTDEQLAYRQLYEYASSLYPLAIPELYIANWYANKIILLQQSGASTQEEYAPSIAAAFGRIRSARVELEKSLQDENASGFAPIALTLMGQVFGKLTLASQRATPSIVIKTEEEGITLKAAEDAYLQALQQRALHGESDDYERFYYAAFLLKYYPKREEDLKKILSNFLTPAYTDAPIMKFFQGQRGVSTWMNGSLTAMAKVDPEFKKLLVSLGWLEADFK